MKNTYIRMLGALILITTTTELFALEVDREVNPRLTIGGRAIATLDAFRADDRAGVDDNNEINTEDSSLLLRLDKRMYGDGVAGAVVGLTQHDDTATFHQTHAFYWNRNFEVRLGRSRLRNSLLELPLIRDDDFLAYTHIGNASSNEEFDQIFGDIASFDWFVDQKNTALGFWAESRRDDVNVTQFKAPEGIDSWGAGLVYEQSEDLRYIKWIRHAGIRGVRQLVEVAPNDYKWMSGVIAGAEFNLGINPQDNWSMAIQGTYNAGLKETPIVLVDTLSNQARAKSSAYVASLRYTKRPNLLTRFQAALSVGYKNYDDVNDASQITIAPSLFYRLGQGVDVVAQFRRTRFADGLGGGIEQVGQVGLAFGLDTRMNNNIGERNSILNLEHGYIQ